MIKDIVMHSVIKKVTFTGEYKARLSRPTKKKQLRTQDKPNDNATSRTTKSHSAHPKRFGLVYLVARNEEAEPR